MVILSPLFLSSCSLNRYPITMSTCTNNFKDCEPMAKFKTLDECETTAKHWNTICDNEYTSSCHIKTDAFAISHCSE